MADKIINYDFWNWMRIRSFGMLSISILLITIIFDFSFIQSSNDQFGIGALAVLLWFIIFIGHSFLIYKSRDGVTNQVLLDKIDNVETQIINKEIKLEKQMNKLEIQNNNNNKQVVNLLTQLINQTK